MESQPQNPEFRINPENFHLCYWLIFTNSNRKYHDQMKQSVVLGLHKTVCKYTIIWDFMHW